jgi:DNA-binding transcriptional LysR family regulator
VEIRELRAFIAVVEEGALSAAARRLHLSQSALSQTIAGLERQLDVELVTRVRPTDAGRALLTEARAVLARHDQALATIARRSSAGGSLRLGIPLELPPDLLSGPLAELAAAHPNTKVAARHLATAAQFAALADGELDVGLVREHPIGTDLDAMLIRSERLGVLLHTDVAHRLGGPDGVRLNALAGLDWVSFARSGSPAWYDEIVAILRSHGLDLGGPAPDGQELIAEVKLAGVATGDAFTLAPPNWSQPLPDSITWLPLVGHPLIRRTWVVWQANAQRRDIATFVAAFD